ncbi:hypothetical protein [Megasphaera elsdenii]|uniref:hypothetical protein n=1 Tax=Megasphaera elsdenii TaxID=907 RepID=UPI00265D9F7A|nr:hypothetical protein [Megasphaera elsdenii]
MARTISFCIIAYEYRLRGIGYRFIISDNNATNGLSIGLTSANNNLAFRIAQRSIAYDYTVRIACISFTYYDSIFRIINSISCPVDNTIFTLILNSITTSHCRCLIVSNISISISCPNRHCRQRCRQGKGCQNSGFSTTSAAAATYMAVVMALGQF